MYPVLYKAGLASQPTATHKDDGLKLKGAYITAVARCAPPGNKPTPAELANCSEFLDRELEGLSKVKVVLVLGKIAFDGYLGYLKRCGIVQRRSAYIFGHGVKYRLPNGKILLASYHPSMQNTLTGKLTEKMFLKVVREAAKLALARS